MSWAAQRARFPVLEHRAYLNAGSNGPLARETLDAMATVREREGRDGRSGKPYVEEMLAARDRVRALIAAQASVPAKHLALTTSTTQGAQIAVVGLGLGPGDEVVSTDSEHFGMTGPLLAAGVDLRVASILGRRPDESFDLIKAMVTPRTRLLALSAVSWLDGRLIPWRELREATGVPVLVDGAQSVGAVPVDATGSDFYTISGQKWLCGPDWTGALYVAEPDALPVRLAAYPSALEYDIRAGTWEPKPGALRFDPGFMPNVSLAGLEAALTTLPDGRFERARKLADRCCGLLEEAGVEVVTEPGQGTLVSFRPPSGNPAETVAALYDIGVIVRDLPHTDFVRASVGWWNDEGDLERLVAGVSAT